MASLATETCKIEERKQLINKMNPREITILVYELFELYSNLPFIKSLGWKPKISLEEGLSKTIKWYK